MATICLTMRPAAVAGAFYPKDRQELASQVSGFLQAAPHGTLNVDQLKALIVPHAGYVYSGAVAASAYACLKPLRTRIKRVVMIGPAHRVWIPAVATTSVQLFETPLGRVPVDRDAITTVAKLPWLQTNDAAHGPEHSLEVQLPFLQTVLDNFGLVPFVAGAQATSGQIAEILDLLWGGPETLIVISSDLSHYLPYDQAKAMDQRSIDSLLQLTPLLEAPRACGATPINGLLEVARRRGLQPQLLDLRNSGDTAGPKDRVVGYASLAFLAPPVDDPMLTLGRTLLCRARQAISEQLAGQRASSVTEEPDTQTQATLATPGAVFVTLSQKGQLRGCIGSLSAWRPLATDVVENAKSAAFRDPRFPPLTSEELDRTRVEVSLLSPAQPMSFTSQDDAIQQLRPNVDGVILEWQGRRGTFLPQVWESLPDRQQFFRHLKQKAGLAMDFWADDVKLYRYQVQKWKEPETH